jgi:hypothetical protein
MWEEKLGNCGDDPRTWCEFVFTKYVNRNSAHRPCAMYMECNSAYLMSTGNETVRLCRIQGKLQIRIQLNTKSSTADSVIPGPVIPFNTFMSCHTIRPLSSEVTTVIPCYPRPSSRGMPCIPCHSRLSILVSVIPHLTS